MIKLYVNPNKKEGHLNPELQGHFSEHLGRCIYEGIYVGENSSIPNENGMRKDVVEALKEIKIPVLRWPGGCFADEYHWKDGIGPKETRKKMINTNWGGVVEDNSFGTHEFMELCKQLGCKAYINGNVGSGTVQEMSEWVEYMTFQGVSPMADLRKENGHEESWRVDYFGVGNENWGCGGNMRPEYYGDLYRRYQTYIKNYDSKKPIAKIACGPNGDDYDWTYRFLKTIYDHGNKMMDGFSLHYYTIPTGVWEQKGSATEFDDDLWYLTMKNTKKMKELIERHSAIMDQFDPAKEIALIVDEWGIWADVEPGTNPGFLYQQNTMRDAMVAGINLNIFNKHCDRVKMANIAQMVNVLQAVILTEGDKMIKTPTWSVFHMYNVHQDADLLQSDFETEDEHLTESVSVDQDGVIHMTITNESLTESKRIESIFAQSNVKSVKGVVLHAEKEAHNTFENPCNVKEAEFTDYTYQQDKVTFTMPACSVVRLDIELER